MKMFTVFLVFGFCVVGTGCSESDPLNRQPVTGEILLDSVPVANGTIEFSPIENGTPSGAVIQEGKFEIPANKGLPPGDYLVRISAYNEEAEAVALPGESNKVAEELIPSKYNTDSEITFTAKADDENVFNLNVEK